MALWLKESSLQLNISKTKALCCHRCWAPETPHPLSTPLRLEGQVVEQVKHFKYLGTHIDQRLSFTQHGDRVYKKAQQRMCPLRKLKGFVVRKVISLTVYQTLIGSVISFNITSWHSFLASRCQEKLARIIKQANKITSIQQKQLSDLHTQAVERKTNSILLDPSHPLHGCFELLT